MTTSSTHNMLHQYLATVNNDVSISKDKKNKTIKSKAATSSICKSNMDKQANCILNRLVDLQNKLQTKYKQLSTFQLQLVADMIDVSTASLISYTTLVNALVERLNICPYQLKKEFVQLIELDVLLCSEHQWQGQMVKINPLLLSEAINIKCVYQTEIYLEQYELLSSYTIQSFEKQLVLLMFELKALINKPNFKGKLNKLFTQELKTKCLVLNPLLMTISKLCYKQLHRIEEEPLIRLCDDELVRFIIEIALELECVTYDGEVLIWQEDRGVYWLQLSNVEQVKLLKLLLCQIFERYIHGEQYISLLKYLYSPTEWVQRKESSYVTTKQVVELITSFGWLDVLYNETTFIVKHKQLYKYDSMPIILPQLHILCLPDCDLLQLWKLRAVSSIDKFADIIRLDITSDSIAQALAETYSEEELLALLVTADETVKSTIQRLIMLNKQQLEQSRKDITNRKKGSDITGGKRASKVVSHNREQQVLSKLVMMIAHNTPQNIRHEIDRCEAELSHYAVRWFTTLSSYNMSTTKRIVECAIEQGISLEAKINNEHLYLVPRCIKQMNHDYYVEYIAELNSKRENKDSVQQLLLSSILKLRLYR